MKLKRKVNKIVKRGKKAVKKAMRSETMKDLQRKEKLVVADLLEKTAKKLKKK